MSGSQLLMVDLDIQMLGPFRVCVDGREVEETRWSRKKARVLVKLLALAPNRRLHREQLLEILWADAEPELALNNLHKAIHAARRALEPKLAQGSASRFLLTQDTYVALAGAPAVRIDLEEFEQRATAALKSRNSEELEAALLLYSGDLLEEDRYEDWALVPRERARLKYQQLLEAVARNYDLSADNRALEGWIRVLAANPANEEGHRRLMELYAGNGQRHLALNQYKICCEVLRQELDAVPDVATVRLYERILAGEVSTAPERVATTPSIAERAAIPEIVPSVQTASKRFRWNLALAGAIGLTIVMAALAWWLNSARHQQPASLAILPLRGIGSGNDMEYIADGITDGLINSISRIPGTRVLARATVFAYKSSRDSRAVGRELKVSAVVSGRVQKIGNSVEVGIELIDVGDGARLWARKYTVAAGDIASIQQLLNTELAGALKVKLTDKQRAEQSKPTTGDAEAYRLYLTGRHFWNQRTTAGFRKSIENYENAIRRDPNYALAYAGLADSYGLLGFSSGSPRDYFPKARDAATRALQLDESLAEAQTSLAMVSALYDWNWPTAEAQFRRAIEINPGYVTAHHWLGVHLSAMGRFADARQELERARNLDPLSPIVNLNYGYPDFFQRKYAAAGEIFMQALALNPGFAPAHKDLMALYEREGRLEDAAREAVEWLRLDGPPDLAARIERNSGSAGYKNTLRMWLAYYEAPLRSEYVSPMIPALLAAQSDNPERCFFWLDRAFEERSPQLVYLGVDPQFDSVARDPRFQQMLRRVGLPVTRVSPQLSSSSFQ